MKGARLRGVAFAVAAAALMMSTQALAATLVSATADLTGGTLTIKGTDLTKGPRAPQVYLGTTALTIIGAATNAQIVALLPPVLPGTYLLTVTTGPGNAHLEEMWITVGASGSAGPKGDTGAQGPKGETGATGPAGPKGEAGVAGPAGAKGDAGPKGDTGATGAQGATGAAGPAGPKGDAGLKGETGAQGAKGEIGATGLQGPKGDTGATGAQGATGAAGLQGPKGDTGATGAQGATGAAGPQGSAGATGGQGPQGPAGPAGSSVTVEQLSVGDTNCPRGGAKITAQGAIAYVCGYTDSPPPVVPGSNLIGAADFAQINQWAVLSPSTQWTLCYRQSTDGASSATFHAKCDNKGRTFFVARTSAGKLLGGYASIGWTGGGGYKTDNNAFLFSMSNNHRHGLLGGNNNYAVYDVPGHGPTMGSGWDIKVEGASGSTGLGTTFSCHPSASPGPDCWTDFAGAATFTYTELEVFHVQ